MDNVTRLLMQGAAGAAGGVTYVDDVFSTYLYKGSASATSINNGIDLAGEGGMTWIKDRGYAYNHVLQDTVRGAGATTKLASNLQSGQGSGDNALQWAGYISAFNNNGFSLDKTGSGSIDWANVNKSNDDYTSWSFRKQKGFFDIVTYTGNGSNRTIAHNLGSIPGVVLIKNLTASQNWVMYHRSIGNTGALLLDDAGGGTYATSYWNDTSPTASNFTVGTDNMMNGNGNNYVAYIFAGGASTAATARSVVCDGTGDYLSLGSSSDLAMGTGDFTIEGWYNINAKQNFGFFMNGPSGLSSTYGTTVWNYTGSTYGLQFFGSGNSYVTGFTPPSGQWFHLALVRNSGTTSLYYNGKVLRAVADNTNYTNNTFQIGGYDSSPYLMNGSVSNFRIVKGTAVYTSSFRPSTEPLTAITNTVLLCCNNSSTTGSTVTPGTITANGDPTASTDSPFDDSEGFKFGEEGDQNIIKTGGFTGTGVNQRINLGFEPQWFLWKQLSSNSSWIVFDSMRGMVTGYNDAILYPEGASAEVNSADCISLDPDGVTFIGSGGLNPSGHTFIYMAIRRPDPLVAKPIEAGTEVFAIDNDTNAEPDWRSNFPVDFAFSTQTTGSNWWTSARLLQGIRGYIDTSDTFVVGNTWADFDWMNGWSTGNFNSSTYSWMFKRHAGFDVVTYEGNANNAGSITDLTVKHNLGRVPEMIWIKNLDSSYEWYVYHKGLNGGTNPQNYTIQLSTTNAQANDGVMTWQGKLPTSKAFTLGGHFVVNKENNTSLAMLFASVEGISKVGYYDGTGAAGHVITTGFTPRLLIIKTTTGANSWFLYDSLRGLGAGNDPYLQMENNNAEGGTGDDVFATSSTGFTINQNYHSVNASGQKYIYYAHA